MYIWKVLFLPSGIRCEKQGSEYFLLTRMYKQTNPPQYYQNSQESVKNSIIWLTKILPMGALSI